MSCIPSDAPATGGKSKVATEDGGPRFPPLGNRPARTLSRAAIVMQNWIGIGIWIVLGMLIAMGMRALIKRPEETPGHAVVLAVLGAFGAVVGGMLGVGIIEFFDPRALSMGGMLGAIFFAMFISWLYRWGIRTLT